MEDRRITKTKTNIKATLTALVAEMPFEKITVSEICRRGKISRITFYTHYDDKYALAEELYADFIAEAHGTYYRLQRENNSQGDDIQGYISLLEAILALVFDHYDFFSHTTAHENPYLYSGFFGAVYNHVLDYFERHRALTSRLPVRQTASLLCNSIFGVISSCAADRLPEEETRRMIHEIYRAIIGSDLFSR